MITQKEATTSVFWRKPDVVDPANYKIYLLINYLTYLGIVSHVFYIFLFKYLDFELLSNVNIISSLTWITGRFFNKNGKHRITIILLTLEIVLHTTLCNYYLGWSSGFQYYLIPTIPFLMYNNILKTYQNFLSSTAIGVLFIFLYYLSQNRVYNHEHPDIISSLSYVSITFSFVAIMIVSHFLRIASTISDRYLQILANTDALTGLLNRRGALVELQKQMNLSSRKNSTFSIILSDIDNFKIVNDTHGHDCGDAILKDIAAILRNRMRPYDLVSRWGGEEFLFLLPETELSDARIVAEDLRRSLAQKNFQYGKISLHTTMTFGISQFRSNQNLDDILKDADDALYSGKHKGRNCVEAKTFL